MPAVLAALLLSAGWLLWTIVVDPPPPTPSPGASEPAVVQPAIDSYEGNWIGITGQQYPLAFTIVGDVVTSVSGTIVAESVKAECPRHVESVAEQPVAFRLEDDSVLIELENDAMGLRIDGLLTSGNSARGSFSYASKDECKYSVATDWTATKAPPTVLGAASPSIASPDPAFKEALDGLTGTPPVYETQFDGQAAIWQPGGFWRPAGATLEAGTLIARSGSGFTGAREQIPTSDRFAFGFDLRNPDPSTLHGPCQAAATHGLSEDASWRGFTLLLHHNGYVELGTSSSQTFFERVSLSHGRFDFSRFNTAVIIVLRNRVGVFMNGEMVVTMSPPEDSGLYTQRSLGAYAYATCEFDNYKLWDLGGAVP